MKKRFITLLALLGAIGLVGCDTSIPTSSETSSSVQAGQNINVLLEGTDMIDIGETAQMFAYVDAYDNENSLTWTSSNPGVAAITSTGLLTGISYGEATIAAIPLENPLKMATMTVTVVKDAYIVRNMDEDGMFDESELDEIEVDDDYEIVQVSSDSNSFWTDILLNRQLAYGNSYEMSITANNTDTHYTAYSSNLKVMTIEHEAESKILKLNAVGIGDSVLTIYNYREELVCRKVIRIRYGYDKDHILRKAYMLDEYKGWNFMTLSGHESILTVTSVDGDTARATYIGYDDVETSGVTLTFDLSYNDYYESIDMYSFTCTEVESSQGSQTSLLEMTISATGDEIHLYYNAGSKDAPDSALLMILVAKQFASYHPEIA